MNKMYLVIGDWSQDGHNQSYKVLCESNKTLVEVQEAYKQSCKNTGVSFNHDEDYTDLVLDHKHTNQVCTEYEENTISEENKKLLIEYGVVFDDNLDAEDFQEDFENVLLQFIKLADPSMVLNSMPKEKDIIPYINGYWDDTLNVQFGYGLFD